MAQNGKGRNGLLRLQEGDECPRDFWRYSINPITGWYYASNQDNHRVSDSKYYKIHSLPTEG